MKTRYLKYALFTLLAVTFIAVQALAQVEEPPTNIAIIMDASGSMQALLEGGRSRITVARDEIIALSSQLSPSVNASLWVYGHRLSQDDPAASCLDIEEIIPLSPADAAAFASTVSSVDAIGYTPIATTLGMAYSSLPARERDVIVLMSDGEESCGGDPCAVAAALDERNIELRIHTIGFAADAGTRAQLQCIADVTGGNYYEAQDTEGLRQALRAATTPVTGAIAVVNSAGEIAAGVGFTVVNSAGETVGTVVGSSSFAPGDYSVTVNTEPPLEANVTVVAGETATITLPELGSVRVVNAAGEVLEQFPLTAFAPATNDIVGFGAAGTVQLPPGRYDVAVGDMTDQWETVTLAAGETVDIVVDFGAIQLVDANGTPTDAFPFYIFDVGGVEVFESVSTGFTNLPAGSYDVEVQTDPRLRQTVSVNPGETTEVALPGLGILEVVDSTGAPITDYRFQVFPQGGTGQTIFSSEGMVELLAGNYDVEVATSPPTIQSVVITAGETTQIVLPGIGTIQLVDADGNPTDAYSFYVSPQGDNSYLDFSVSGVLTLAEGSYDVEVNVDPRIFQTVTVTAGQTTQVMLPGIGTIQIVDAQGNPADEYLYVYSPDSNTGITSGYESIDIVEGTYDVEVLTSPVTRQTVTVTAGETSIVQLGGIGTVQLLDAEGNPTDEFSFYVYAEGDTSSSVAYTTSGSTEVVAGTYEVEVLTNPPLRQTVTVVVGEVATVQLGGIGIIQLVDAQGNPTDEYPFYVYPEGDDDYIAYTASGTTDVAAGIYDVEVLTSPPTRQTVTIGGGETGIVQLGGIGTIQLVDAQGNPTDEYPFYVYPEGDDDYIAYASSGTTEVAIGTYMVEVYSDPHTFQTITVVADEVATVQLSGIGTLQLVDAAGNPSDADAMYIYVAGNEDYDAYASGGEIDLLVGDYEVEFVSQFGTRYPVTIVADETTEISLP